MTLEGTEWERIGGIEVDGATVAIAEAAHFDAIVAAQEQLLRMGDGSSRALDIEMVTVCTRVDMFFPVEVARGDDGSLAGLRVEFVDDVADLDGVWRVLDTITLNSGECLVADPFRLPDEAYTLELASPTGSFPVEVFEYGGELLGVRVVFTR